MADERFAEHLAHPHGLGLRPAGAQDGHAGGALCGDLVRISVTVEGACVRAAGFDAEGCGALTAAASAACSLVEGAPVLDAARVGTHAIAAELGGLSPGKLHAAELAADALHAALGEAAWRDADVPATGDRALVAMSGGVDSSVAAALTPGAVGVTVELWRDPENDAESSCCSASAVRAARAAAHALGIPHLTLDLREPFRRGVVEPWVAGLAAGVTPNPCVRCNGDVRIDAMLDLADRLGCETLTTGHYARRTPDGLLRLAADPRKDQAFMLSATSRATLARLRFPLGEMTKDQVRAKARELGLASAQQPDSQDLCFLAGTRSDRFLARHGDVRAREGDVVDRAGRRIGRHRGAHLYTVGQRRGLRVDGAAEPLYVLATDVHANTVTAGPRDALARGRIGLDELRLHGDPAEVDGVRLRSHAPTRAARLEGDELVLAEPCGGAAPGQTAVLLRQDVVLGCGTIRR